MRTLELDMLPLEEGGREAPRSAAREQQIAAPGDDLRRQAQGAYALALIDLQELLHAVAEHLATDRGHRAIGGARRPGRVERAPQEKRAQPARQRLERNARGER